jgi:hypothetical protein
MKQPGGSATRGCIASAHGVAAMAWRVSVELPGARTSSSNASAAYFTVSSLNGTSWLTHWS